MIQEVYVSFEVAKLLKEKGFDGEFDTHMFYSEFDKTIHPIMEIGLVKDEDVYFAPTHQMALAWLREKGFHINVSISYDISEDADGNIVEKWTFWLFEILSSFAGDIIYTEENEEYESYEEAVETALKYALENLIK